MSKSLGRKMIGALGFTGVIVLIVGLVTGLYSFTVGLVVAVLIWIVASFVAKFSGLKGK